MVITAEYLREDAAGDGQRDTTSDIGIVGTTEYTLYLICFTASYDEVDITFDVGTSGCTVGIGNLQRTVGNNRKIIFTI